MEKNCVVCHLRPSLFRCIQCHKPVCDDDSFKDDQGVFCSRNCAAAHRSFKQSSGGSQAKSGGAGRMLLIIVVLVVIILGAMYAMKLGPFAATEPAGGQNNGAAEQPADEGAE